TRRTSIRARASSACDEDEGDGRGKSPPDRCPHATRGPLSGAASMDRLDDVPSGCQRDIARAESPSRPRVAAQRRRPMATCRPLSAASIALSALGVLVSGCKPKPPPVDDHAQTSAPAPQPAVAQYPVMAPLDEYLIADRDAEVALARSAA